MKKTIILFALIIVVTGACSSQQSKERAETPAVLTEAVSQTQAQAQLAATPKNDLYSDGRTKLIKTAKYRFEVSNVKKSTETILLAVRKYPAYVSASSLHLENPVLENVMTIRVQSEYFQDLLQDIDPQAIFVNYRDVTTEDVSKDFVDLESRIRTKREVEMRYMEILRKKAGTIEELLHAEQEIGKLHEEIEAAISRINYLKEQVSYSTIELQFYQTIEQDLHAGNEMTVGEQFSEGFSSGWEGVVTICIGLAYIWPVLAIVGVVLILKYVRTMIRWIRVI